MISIIISIMIGFIFGCWLSLSNIKDVYYEKYLDLYKDERKLIFILVCIKSKDIIDKIVHWIKEDINNVREIWQNNNSKKEQ